MTIHVFKKKGAGYAVVSNDALGGRDKSLAALRQIVNGESRSKQSVVVDNTHVDVEARRKFIEVAKKAGLPVRCFVMSATFEQVWPLTHQSFSVCFL